MKDKVLHDYLNQPRVRQFLRDGWVPTQLRQIIMSPDVPVAVKDALIDNLLQENVINDFVVGRLR